MGFPVDAQGVPMGMTLSIESDPPTVCPVLFPDTDGKAFLGTFFGPHVEVLQQRIQFDLSALRHCAVSVEDDDEKDFGADWLEQMRQGNELAWHPPETFVACLEKLAVQLRDWDKKLPVAICRVIDPTGHRYRYYRSKNFYGDVCGCLAAMRHLQAQGVQRVRFFAF